MSLPTPETMRRGWCPGTLRPMQTGDGWLVRLHPPRGTLAPAQLAFVSELATRHGNGQIEISSRGNLQLRGVREASHPVLVAELLEAGLVDEATGDGPHRLVLASPLAGREAGELLDAAALAAAVESAGRHIAGLPAKFSIVVDGGGTRALDGFAADLRLRAVAADSVAFGLPGGLWFGPVDPTSAPAIAAMLLAGFAAEERVRRGEVRRMRELDDKALVVLSVACGLSAMSTPAIRPSPSPVGIAAERNGRFAVLAALPFGRSDAAGLARLSELAERFAVEEIRLSPWRGLGFCGISKPAAVKLAAALVKEGLVLSPRDPRLPVSACAGAPACDRAAAPTLADAETLSEALAPLLAGGLTLHVSGCTKSCARQGAADLTLLAGEAGYDVILAGGTRDKPIAHLTLAELVRRLEPGQDIRARLETAARHRE
ncbi:MAG TPA: precorrin-3B synthase [Bosea sp. (in: a-proteobacteria)]|jgi:precorrin-3B synthase|uniref:precorrin-3B synthase n=1 Tax=Bosea sp. (in: a-proteobacteria) TaxID=1871050 RepID=UPI002E0F2C1C|nr:precorrin-3B synthase [Bosea sp. (in: a-proteobacteria)]